MVIPDLNHLSKPCEIEKTATVLSRVLSFIIDYFIFTPVISFTIFILFRNGIELYKKFPSSDEAENLFFYILIGTVFISTFIQALFISIWGSTPGQYFLKLRIKFKSNDMPLFLQAWFRQIGFVLSFFMFGIPFIKILIDQHKQCFYEKMTDSEVVFSSIINFESFVVQKNTVYDKKFWSASMSTLCVFGVLFFAVVLWRGYLNVLTSPFYYSKFINKKSMCTEFSEFTSTERLRHKIAMNLVGTLSDDCLDQEADFTLWRNFSEDQSLAYFAKFISTDNSDLEVKYLNQACKSDSKSEGCYWSTIFRTQNFSDVLGNDFYKSTILGQIVTYELNKKLSDEDKKNILQSLYKKQSHKSIKKFLIVESVQKILKSNSNVRKPANLQSTDESNDEIYDIKEMIRDL